MTTRLVTAPRSAPATHPHGVFLGLRLPRPANSQDLHGASAARAGIAQAQVDTALLTALMRAVTQADDAISLELWGGASGRVRWAIWTPDQPALRQAVVSAIEGAAPGGEIQAVADPAQTLTGHAAWATCALTAESAYPWLELREAQTDPLGAFFGAFRPQPGVTTIGLQIMLAPAPPGWRRRAEDLAVLDEAAHAAEATPALAARAALVRAKALRLGVQVSIRVVVAATSAAVAAQHRETFTAALAQPVPRADATQGWTVVGHGVGRAADMPLLRTRPIRRPMGRIIPLPPPFAPPRVSILTADELACLWHLPTARQLRTAIWRPNTFLPPDPALVIGPRSAPPEAYHETVPLGDRVVRVAGGRAADGTEVYLGVPLKSFLTHTHILGTTGAGKSHTLQVLVGEVLRVGGSFGVIDHKGDLIRDILRMIPPERFKDVVLFDPTASDWRVGINILDPAMLQAGVDLELLCSTLETFIAASDPNWATAKGMQEFIGWGCKALMLGEPTPTLTHLWTFFASEAYRAQVLQNVTDVQTRQWWEVTFPQLSEQQKNSMQALQRRLGQFLRNGTVRRVCNQLRTTVPFRKLMDGRGIFLAKLPMEIIGKQEGAFLANLVVSMIVAAAFSRHTLAEAEREPWLLIIDEFQESVGRCDPEQFKSFLERLRSFGLGAVLAHQETGQIPPELLSTILGIVQNRLVLSAFGNDGRVWQGHYAAANLPAADWDNIPTQQEGYMNLSVRGRRSDLGTFLPLPLWPLPNTAAVPVEGDWRLLHPVATTPEEARYDALLTEFAHYDPADVLALLMQAPADQWEAYKARARAWRAYQRAAILVQPGLIPDPVERLKYVSWLETATPDIEVMAQIDRLLLQFPADAEPAKPKRNPKPDRDRRRDDDGAVGGPAYEASSVAAADPTPAVMTIPTYAGTSLAAGTALDAPAGGHEDLEAMRF